MIKSHGFCRTFTQEGYQFLNPASFEDGRALSVALGSDFAEARRSRIELTLETQLDNGRELNRATAPWYFAGSSLIVREEMLSGVAKILSGAGNFIPLQVQAGTNEPLPMWYFHTDAVVRDMNHAESTLRVVPNGRVASVKKLVLTGQNSPYPDVFKIDECRDLYCFSSKVVLALRELILFSGTVFKEL